VKVLLYCGLEGCEHRETTEVDPVEWLDEVVAQDCPDCGKNLSQKEGHFEDLNAKLQRERYDLAHKPGPLTEEETERLREIHRTLGHKGPGEFDAERESLIMKITSEVMARIRNAQQKN
jgi:hypothetical protein